MSQPNNSPESAFRVTLSESEVTCRRPNGEMETVAWNKLQAVLIETTDTGPLATDVFWILVGEDSGCVIPQGATGEAELLAKLQSLPNFDNAAVIEAMTST